MKRAIISIMVMALVVITLCTNAFAAKAKLRHVDETTFVVKKGDNFWKLSKRYHESWHRLQTVNGPYLRYPGNPHWIFPGQVLVHTKAYIAAAKLKSKSSSPSEVPSKKQPIGVQPHSSNQLSKKGAGGSAVSSKPPASSAPVSREVTSEFNASKEGIDRNTTFQNSTSAIEKASKKSIFVRFWEEMPTKYFAILFLVLAMILATLIFGGMKKYLTTRRSVFVLKRKDKTEFVCIDYFSRIYAKAFTLEELAETLLRINNYYVLKGCLKFYLLKKFSWKYLPLDESDQNMFAIYLSNFYATNSSWEDSQPSQRQPGGNQQQEAKPSKQRSYRGIKRNSKKGKRSFKDSKRSVS